MLDVLSTIQVPGLLSAEMIDEPHQPVLPGCGVLPGAGAALAQLQWRRAWRLQRAWSRCGSSNIVVGGSRYSLREYITVTRKSIYVIYHDERINIITLHTDELWHCPYHWA
jgi:hypothetical protein